MPRVAVVIPWRETDDYRSAALEWVLGRYRTTHPDWDVIVAPGDEPWCKAIPVATAIDSCDADIVIVADADVWTPGLEAAVQQVEHGAAWAIPHLLVHRLSPTATKRLLAGSDTSYEYDQAPYPGMPGGGIVIAHRAVLAAIPMDHRFVGWGQEDESWAAALHALLGPPWRGTADLVHLWHPPQPRMTRVRGTQEGWRLRRRYMKARHDPAYMRALLEEARRDLRPAQQALHDHPAHSLG